jgi:hypothetical protein
MRAGATREGTGRVEAAPGPRRGRAAPGHASGGASRWAVKAPGPRRVAARQGATSSGSHAAGGHLPRRGQLGGHIGEEGREGREEKGSSARALRMAATAHRDPP